MSLLQHVAEGHTGTSTDFARTLTAGLNRLALVCIQQEGAAANTFTATLDSVPMTPIPEVSGQVTAGANTQHLSWFGLLEEDLGEGAVTLNSTSSTTEDNTSVHFMLFDGVAQTLSFPETATDFTTGATNPKEVTVNASALQRYEVVAVAGCGNDVGYTITHGGVASDSDQAVSNAATTAGHSAVWVNREANGNQTVSATASATVNRSALAALVIQQISLPQNGGNGRQRREVINPAVGGINITDDYLETLLPLADNYHAHVMCNINRNCTVTVEVYEGASVVDSEDLDISPADTSTHIVPFTTISADSVVRITISSVTGNTSSGVTLEMDCEVTTALGEFPTDNN